MYVQGTTLQPLVTRPILSKRNASCSLRGRDIKRKEHHAHGVLQHLLTRPHAFEHKTRVKLRKSMQHKLCIEKHTDRITVPLPAAYERQESSNGIK